MNVVNATETQDLLDRKLKYRPMDEGTLLHPPQSILLFQHTGMHDLFLARSHHRERRRLRPQPLPLLLPSLWNMADSDCHLSELSLLILDPQMTSRLPIYPLHTAKLPS